MAFDISSKVGIDLQYQVKDVVGDSLKTTFPHKSKKWLERVRENVLNFLGKAVGWRNFRIENPGRREELISKAVLNFHEFNQKNPDNQVTPKEYAQILVMAMRLTANEKHHDRKDLEALFSGIETEFMENDSVQIGDEVGRGRSESEPVIEEELPVENEIVDMNDLLVQLKEEQTTVKSNTPKYDEMVSKYTPSSECAGILDRLDRVREELVEKVNKLRNFELNGKSELAEQYKMDEVDDEIDGQEHDEIDGQVHDESDIEWTYNADLNFKCNVLKKLKNEEIELINRIKGYVQTGATIDEIRRLHNDEYDDFDFR